MIAEHEYDRLRIYGLNQKSQRPVEAIGVGDVPCENENVEALALGDAFGEGHSLIGMEFVVQVRNNSQTHGQIIHPAFSHLVYKVLMPNIRTPDTKGIDHHKLPVGLNISRPVKGEFEGLPLFAWVSVRDKVNTPLVMLTLLLTKDAKVEGSLSMELPYFPGETEDSIVSFMAKLGWDGKVWPKDGGWPTQPLGSEEDETSIKSLLGSSGLKACMNFPPSPEGVPLLEINVQRAKGPFLMPPLPPPEGEVDATLKAKLQELCANPKVFHSQQKPLIFKP